LPVNIDKSVFAPLLFYPKSGNFTNVLKRGILDKNGWRIRNIILPFLSKTYDPANFRKFI